MERGKWVLRRLMPHLVGVVVLVALPLVYFWPLLEGKELAQHDRVQWQGTARELIAHRDSHDGEQSLWTNALFGGMPSVLVSLSYPRNVVSLLDGALTALPRPANYIALTMLGFYILLLVLRVNPWQAIAGAVAYGFSTYFFIILGAGHNAKSHALCYMAPMVAGAIAAYRGKYLGGGVLFGLSLALSLVAGHLQITYYTLFVVGAVALWGLYEGVRGRSLSGFARASGVLALAGVLAVGANFNRLYNTWDYGRESIRGQSDLRLNNSAQDGGLDRAYATSWSYGLNETFNLMVPQFNGGASTVHLDGKSESSKFLRSTGLDAGQQAQVLRSLPVYWGPQPITSGPVYLGASVLLLFVVGMLLVRNGLKWWLLGVGVLGLLLSWGKHFPWLTNLFFDWVPGYNKFRTVSMILVICELTVPLVAFMGLGAWVREDAERVSKMRALKWGVIGSMGLVLLLLIVGPGVFDFSSPYDAQYAEAGFPVALLDALRQDRIGLMKSDALRSLLMMGLTAVVLLLSYKNKLKPVGLSIAVSVIVLIDLWPIAKRYDGVQYVSATEYAEPFQATGANLAINQDRTHYRVMNLSVSTFNDASTSYFHNSVGGYHGAKLRRFQDFVDRYASHPLFTNLLNVKYLIVPSSDGRGVSAERNGGAFGNAWFVDSVRGVSDADEEIGLLADVDLRRTAVIDTSRFALPSLAEGEVYEGDSIWLSGNGANWQRYGYRAGRSRYAVFSEIYYPRGWSVDVDGLPVKLDRVNYLLRGALLPAGEHEVQFRFALPMFELGQWIDLVFGLLLLLSIIGWAVCVCLRAAKQCSVEGGEGV